MILAMAEIIILLPVLKYRYIWFQMELGDDFYIRLKLIGCNLAYIVSQRVRRKGAERGRNKF